MKQNDQYEGLKVWNDARFFVNTFYDAPESTKPGKGCDLSDPLRRASISIPSNIAKGFKRFSNKDFIQFLTYAKASAAKLIAPLHIVPNPNYINQANFDQLYAKFPGLPKQPTGFIRYLKKAKKGAKTECQLSNLQIFTSYDSLS